MILNSPTISGSLTVTGNISSSGSITMSGSQVISGSLTVVTGSGIELQVTNTGVRMGNVITDNHNVTGSLNVSGSITTTGTITAQTLVVQTITSSVDFVTGSTRFGSLLSNTHVFSGSVTMNPGGLFVSSSGLVGIGTTTPTSVLEVQANQNSQTGIRVRNSTAGTSAGVEFGAYTNSGNGGFGKYSTANTPYKNISAASTYVYNGSSGDIALLNDVASGNISFAAGGSSTAQMFISASGNVGIGTTNPSTRFDLSGSIGNFQIASSGAEIFLTRNENNDILATGGTSSGITIGAQSYVRFSCGTSYTERMRITSAGNIQIDSGQLNTPKSLYFQANSSTGGNLGSIDWYNVQWDGAIRAQIKGETDTGLANGRLVFSTGGGGVTERMRITSGGVVYINATSNPTPGNATPQFGVVGAAGTDAVNIKHDQNGNNTVNIWQIGTTSHNAIAFYKGDTQANRGLITVTTSGTTYNSVSDYRLKENIVPLENGLDRVLQLKPSKFNWIETGNETEGFIAHELQEHFPDAVTGEKDAVYSSTGNIKPQSVDYGRITPLLVKAIQELKAQNDDLQSQINELKAQ
jgi:hypothetical protein